MTDSGQGFLWHLFNDPMSENPWSLLLMVAFIAAMFAPVARLWWKTRRRK